MIIRNFKTKINNLHQSRFWRFRYRFFITKVSGKTVIRKSSKTPIYAWSGVLLFGFGGYYFYKTQITNEKVNLVGLFLQSSIIFGFLLRSVFLYASPLIILDKKGIKLDQKKKISWENIDAIRIRTLTKNKFSVNIKMNDGRNIYETLEDTNHSKSYWNTLIKSYYFQFRQQNLCKKPIYKKDFQEQHNSSPVCFANSNEVRDEYK